jgi:N-acetylneuraminic acid mutarotase
MSFLQSWASTTSLPSARGGSACVEYNGYIYIIGGNNISNNATTNTVYYAKINPDNTLGSWTLSSNNLPSTSFAGAVVYNGYIYVMGGVSSGSFISTISYSQINNTSGDVGSWSTIPSGLPSALGGFGAVIYNNNIYVVGGAGASGAVSSVYKGVISSYNSITWTSQNPLSVVRGGLGVVISGNYIYAIGGYGSGATRYSSVEWTQIDNNNNLASWSAFNTTAFAYDIDSLVSVVANNNNIYIVGGRIGTGTPTVTFFSYYSPIINGGGNGNWTMLPDLPSARYVSSGILVNGWVYNIGGTDASGANNTNAYYAQITDPPPPPLNALCFLAPTKILNSDDIYVPISKIKKGDLVKGVFSKKPVKVIHCGHSVINLDLFTIYDFPRKIPKDFFADNIPCNDIYLSGGHSLIFKISNNKALKIPTSRISELDKYEIKSETEIKSITNEEECRYYHIELEDTNEGVIASGLDVETLALGGWERGKFIENV